jgi:chorismate mutase-like protein
MDVLEAYRLDIDAVDRELLKLLARRFAIVRKIGVHKRAAGLDAVSPERVASLLADRAAIGVSLGLRPDLVREVFETMITHAIAMEREEE